MPALLDEPVRIDEENEQGQPEGLAVLEEGYFSDEAIGTFAEDWNLINGARESRITSYPHQLHLWSSVSTAERLDGPCGERKILLRYSDNGAILVILKDRSMSDGYLIEFQKWIKYLFVKKQYSVRTFASYVWVIDSIANASIDNDKALDLVHDNVNELFITNEFDVVEDLLKTIPLNEMTISLIFAWVSSCFQARKKLPSYSSFLERVKQVFKEKAPDKVYLLERYV